MEAATMQVQTVADLFLECLAQVRLLLRCDPIFSTLTTSQAGVDYLFAVLGSDHPSIIEAYTRRQHEGKTWPKMLIFLHEVSPIE